jgi:hypothetical protein
MVNVARMCSWSGVLSVVMRLRVEGPVVAVSRSKRLVIRPWLTSIDKYYKGSGHHGVPGGK